MKLNCKNDLFIKRVVYSEPLAQAINYNLLKCTYYHGLIPLLFNSYVANAIDYCYFLFLQNNVNYLLNVLVM